MYNLPTGDITQVSLGPGILYLGAAGSTPSTDIGYVKGGGTLTIERKQTEIRQGSPQTIVDALVNEENVMLELNGIQWNLDAMLRVLGDGATSVSGADRILKIGGTPGVSKFALRFQHRMADGGTCTTDLWKCIGEGTVAIKINENDVHEVPYKFKAIYPGTTDWGGATLTNGQQLIKIARTAV